MNRGTTPRLPVPSVSDINLYRTVAPSSAESISPEVVTVHSFLTEILVFHSPPSITNLSDVVSGFVEGVGIVPPPLALVSVAEIGITDRVRHPLKRSFESEDLSGG